MKSTHKPNFLLLYVLVFLSGCSGLIYEVVWHRYLAILLGAQARATALVLAIFLGGMCAGYLYFGRKSLESKRDLLKIYAGVEFSLAIWAFLFPLFFKVALPLTGILYHSLGVTNILIDLGVSVLLIGLPTFLMGGTLPLLTQGMSEDFDSASQTHARIYGFNTLGACLGCLLAGYFLIPQTSFSFAMFVGGTLNLLVGTISYYFLAGNRRAVKNTDTSKILKTNPTRSQYALLGVGFLSGFTLLTLETILIRLMGLSTGSSNYNFTLIVAIFIFGLGIGSLLVRRISNYSSTRLLWNQLFCAAALLALYWSGDHWSYWVHVIRSQIRDLPESFYLYQILLSGVFASLLLVPIGLCGITLPLCFHLTKDQPETLGYRVGQLYGVNTAGCVFGALGGGYLLLHIFNLDQLFRLCIFLTLLGAVFAYVVYSEKFRPSFLRASSFLFVGGLTLVLTFLAKSYHKERFIQPFRNAQPLDVTFKGAEAFGNYLGRSTKLVLWKDGPNTTLGVGGTPIEGTEQSRSIFINGKSDGNTRGDFFTTVMLAHIPGVLAKKVDRACVVGFGTGITIGTLALYNDVKQVDVLEISDTVIKNSGLFDAYNGGVSTNPKVKFHEMDAFRFLEGSDVQCDVIVSEPSNPWVSGIENLYSKEFYSIAKKHMHEDSVFAQWIHTYSFNDSLFQMLLHTMGSEFPYVSVFQLKGGDLALVGTLKPFQKDDFKRMEVRMTEKPIKTTLEAAGVFQLETLLALEIVPTSLTKEMGEGAQEHTLQSPRLSNEASKAFFAGTSANVMALRREAKDWHSGINQSLTTLYRDGKEWSSEQLASLRYSFCEHDASKNQHLCEETLLVSKLLDPSYQPSSLYADAVPTRALASVQSFFQNRKTVFANGDLTDLYNLFDSYKQYQSPIAYTDPKIFLGRLDNCMTLTPRTQELWGECLLQKLLVIDGLKVVGQNFDVLAHGYMDWFNQLPTTTPQYAKLRDARDILVKMISGK